jgi:hydrogenase maturation factor
MTKTAGIEGTAILAREFETTLLALGATPEELERSRAFEETPGISVVREATLAAQAGGISAMHDVTEGGVATALEELATACNRRIRVHLQRSPVRAETAIVCSRLGLNPLGLIGSGALLICCRPDSAKAVIDAISDAGIAVTEIGEVLGGGEGVTALDENERVVPWPRFDRDEIARAMADA